MSVSIIDKNCLPTIILFTFACVFKFICQYCSSVPRLACWSHSIRVSDFITTQVIFPPVIFDCVFPLLNSTNVCVLSTYRSFICCVLGTITTLLLRRVVCPPVSPFHPVFVTPLLYSVTLTFCLDYGHILDLEGQYVLPFT